MVRDGQQAIDAFASRPQGTYDAILMDIMMPKIDGYTATRVIVLQTGRMQRPFRSLP